MRDALLDLLLGSRCASCATPGRVLCPACRDSLPSRAFACAPSPVPPGLAPAFAVGEYAGSLKSLVNAHKEHQRFALARPLGDLLALAVLAHAPSAPGRCTSGAEGVARPLVLVPVPSRASVVRRRGHDPLLRIATRAAARVRGQGEPASVVRALTGVRATADQSALGAVDRARNLSGSMACRPGGPPGRLTRARVVVVDDVMTTGATVREAQRALEVAGLDVVGVAVVAATRRTGGRQLVHTTGPAEPV